MTYELAKELKDAGLDVLQHEHCNGCEYDTQHRSYHVPTLSELVEACGEDSGELTLARSAGAWYGEMWDRNVMPYKRTHLVYGSTPEEAVARLWLALNKK
jgi:hypothetical protein